MTALHLRFRHLDAAMLTATGALLEGRTSELAPGQALAEFQQWADTASATYGLPRVTVATGPAGAGDTYSPAAILRLHRPGIVGLLAGYRRHMQYHGITQVGSPDEDAYGWALSLYHTVRPRQLARLVRAGKIPHLTAADLETPDPAGQIAYLTLAGHAGRPNSHGDDEASTDPAARQLQAARDFINRAAVQGRIGTPERDRYLAELDDEHRQALRRAGTSAGALAAIRARAIELYEDGAFCHDGLSDFLKAAGLDPHDGD